MLIARTTDDPTLRKQLRAAARGEALRSWPIERALGHQRCGDGR